MLTLPELAWGAPLSWHLPQLLQTWALSRFSFFLCLYWAWRGGGPSAHPHQLLTSLLKWEGNWEFGYLKSIGFSVQILKIRHLAFLLINVMQFHPMMVSCYCSPAQELNNWPEGEQAPSWLWITGRLADSVYCNSDSPSKFRWVIVWTGMTRERNVKCLLETSCSTINIL